MDRSLLVQRHVERKSGGSGSKDYTEGKMKRWDVELIAEKDRPVKIFPIRYPNQDWVWWEPTFGSEINWLPVKGHTRFIEDDTGKTKGRVYEVVCSAGYEEQDPQPCNGCWEHDDGGKNSPIKQALWRVIQVLADEVFHAVEVQGKKIKYTRHYLCKKLQCKYCKAGEPKFRGRMMFLAMSGKQWSHFLEACTLAGEKCLKCTQDIGLVAVACQACNEVLLDAESWGNEKPEKFLVTPFKCTKCGVVDILGGVYQCVGECDEPEPADVWNCSMKVRRTEGGLSFDDIKVQEIPEELLGNSEPLNLHSLYKPDSLKDQASVLRIENHYSDVA